MRTKFDFSSYRQSTVGFDGFFELLEAGSRGAAPDSYPSFDILKTGGDSYNITSAVTDVRPGVG